MEKRFVKLGDQYYYVEMGEKGLQLIPATQANVLDEKFEQVVLVDPNEEAGDNFLQTIIDESKEEMVKHLKIGLKQTVLGCLGFEKDTWGNNRGFRVDHCNGRMSEVSNHIKVTLQQILKDATIEDLGITDGERQGLIHAYRKDLLESYKRVLRDNLWRVVENMARDDAKAVTESLLKERQEHVAKLVLDKLFISK